MYLFYKNERNVKLWSYLKFHKPFTVRVRLRQILKCSLENKRRFNLIVLYRAKIIHL